MRSAGYTCGWRENSRQFACKILQWIYYRFCLFCPILKCFYRKIQFDETVFGIEVCWFYCPVYHLETVLQTALVRTRNPKVANDHKMWFNEYSIFHIIFILILENFDKLLCLRHRIQFSALFGSKNPVFFYLHSYTHMPLCVQDYFHKKLYNFTNCIISKSRTV